VFSYGVNGQSCLRNSHLCRRSASVFRPIIVVLTAPYCSSKVAINYEGSQGGTGGVTAFILNLGTGYKCVVSFTLRPP